MTRRKSLLHVLLACLTAVAPSACAKSETSSSIVADIAKFGQTPDVATWTPVHADILDGRLTPEAGSRLVNVLVTKDVPGPLENAAAADLTQADFLTTFVDLREANVPSRHDASAQARSIVEKTSGISWLMLALRSPGDTSNINVTNMDLRFGSDFVGVGMNLRNVDFSGAVLSGGSWRGSDISGATFDGVTTTSPLFCRSCTSGNVHATLELVDGRWSTPSRP